MSVSACVTALTALTALAVPLLACLPLRVELLDAVTPPPAAPEPPIIPHEHLPTRGHAENAHDAALAYERWLKEQIAAGVSPHLWRMREDLARQKVVVLVWHNLYWAHWDHALERQGRRHRYRQLLQHLDDLDPWGDSAEARYQAREWPCPAPLWFDAAGMEAWRELARFRAATWRKP